MSETNFYGYVYKIEIHNKKSSMDGCYYIGQHKYQTKYKDKNYYGSGSLIRHYIKKWGLIGLNKTILFECKNKEELNTKEKKYIKDLYKKDSFLNSGKCLNLKSGGNQSDFNDAIKRKISNSHKGMVVTEETKNKIRKTLTGKFRGKNSFAYGYKHTKSAKRKISLYNRGKHLSDTARQKLREFHLGRPLSDYHKKRLSENHADVKGCKNPSFGKHWFTDGIKNFYGFECPKGFKKGMVKNNWRKK